MPDQDGPISVMLSEHQMGRAYTRAMREAALKLEAGESLGREAVIFGARSYVDLLRQHIAKENNVLFPLAGRVIPTAEQDEVAQAFEHVEHEETGAGVHEKYLALAEKLEKEMTD